MCEWAIHGIGQAEKGLQRDSIVIKSNKISNIKATLSFRTKICLVLSGLKAHDVRVDGRPDDSFLAKPSFAELMLDLPENAISTAGG